MKCARLVSPLQGGNCFNDSYLSRGFTPGFNLAGFQPVHGIAAKHIVVLGLKTRHEIVAKHIPIFGLKARHVIDRAEGPGITPNKISQAL